MLSTNQRIAYILDTMRLPIVVNLAYDDSAQLQTVSPWLTFCSEPISRIVLASHLHPDPPGLSTMYSLLYQALAPSETYPYDRMPDELWGNQSLLFAALRQQGFLKQMHLSLASLPSSVKGISERLFAGLSMDLRNAFPNACSDKKVVDEENYLPTFLDVEQWCEQWIASSGWRAEDRQMQDFLTYCETQWSARRLDVQTLSILLEGPWPGQVTSSGIGHRGVIYWHPALAPLCNQKVEIRAITSYLPPSQIEVFVQDRWICSAPFVSSERTV